METCPFCGKAFKRLKSHLPHCRLAAARKNEETGVQLSVKRTNLKKDLLPNTHPSTKERGKVKAELGSERGLFHKSLQEDGRLTPTHGAKGGNSKTVKEDRLVQNAKSENLEKPCLHSSNDLGRSSAEHSLGDSTSHFSGPGGKVTLSSSQDHKVLLQVVPDPSVSEGDGPNDRGQHLGNSRELNLPTTIQKLGTHQKELLTLLVGEEITSEGQDRRGGVLVAGKSLVWEHIQGSFGRSRYSENWSEIFKQVPPLSAPHIPYYGDSTSNISLKGLNNLSGGTTAAQFLYQMDIYSSLTKPSEVVEESRMSGKDPASKGEPVTSQSSSGEALGSLGMQWFPELHPNYVEPRLLPERKDQWDTERRPIKTKMSTNIQHDIPLTSRPLMDVRLGELPSWLANKEISINSLQTTVQKAWSRYYNKYINVKRGSVGGLTMLLAGYCVLSYTWNYKHIQRDRKRKYH